MILVKAARASLEKMTHVQIVFLFFFFFFFVRSGLLTLVQKPPVTLETGFSTCVIVENVPMVDDGPLVARLTGLLSQIFGRCGKLVATDPVYLPIDPQTKKTMG